MKNFTFKNKNFLYFLVHFIALSLFFYAIISLNKNDNITPSYNEIPKTDTSLVVNQNRFNANQKTSSNQKTPFLYVPINSIEQTYNEKYNKPTQKYYLNFQEINAFPELIEARINRVKVSLTSYYTVPMKARLVSLKFKPIEFQNRKLKYVFAISEFGSYEDFGNENTLNIYVPNGKLNLYIRAIDTETNKVTKPNKITTYTNYPISKRLWFWPLMTLVGLAPLLFYFFQVKINQQKQLLIQQKSLEEQRYKITADLHDEIGSTLSSLQINCSVAGFLFEKNPAEAKKILKKIETQSEHLSDKIGDIIWSMKPGDDEFLTLTYRIKHFVSDMVDSTTIHYHIRINEDIDRLVKDIPSRKNIILFVKEAVNNTVKYSKASMLNINIDVVNNHIKMNISDNGIGFDTTINKGNGIGNMKKRMKELHGEFSVVSEPNKGTSITGIIPIVT